LVVADDNVDEAVADFFFLEGEVGIGG